MAIYQKFRTFAPTNINLNIKNMEQIKKMIEAYNKKAKKWGFDEIEVNNGSLNTKFKEKTTIGYSFFGRIKVLYQNGYMKEDYLAIKNVLSQITFNEPKTNETIVRNTAPSQETIEEQALKNTFKE